MNFQKLALVERSKDLLDLAFRKAREKASLKLIKGTPTDRAKKKEGLKLDIINALLSKRLNKIVLSFPETMKLPLFYVELMKLTMDFSQYKKSLGAIVWAVKKLKLIHRSTVSRIAKAGEYEQVKRYSKEYYGRISSVLKQIDPNLSYLEKCRMILRTYPDIKEMFTVCIYGFPNVGKTTLLNKITGTKAKIAGYSFTTLSINAGYLTVGENKVQILDVPGTLARKDKMNNVELQAQLVKKELADLIIYVFDISDTGGYTFEQQMGLYQSLGKEKEAVIYLSKLDLVDSKKVANFSLPYLNLEQLKQVINEKALEKAALYPVEKEDEEDDSE